MRERVCEQKPTHLQHLGEGGRLVKHELFLSLKKKLCLKQSLFACAVMCLWTSEPANPRICSAYALKSPCHRTKWNGWLRIPLTRHSRRLHRHRRAPEQAWQWTGEEPRHFPCSLNACSTAQHVCLDMALQRGGPRREGTKLSTTYAPHVGGKMSCDQDGTLAPQVLTASVSTFCSDFSTFHQKQTAVKNEHHTVISWGAMLE